MGRPGRKPLGKVAMSAAERMRKYREQHRAPAPAAPAAPAAPSYRERYLEGEVKLLQQQVDKLREQARQLRDERRIRHKKDWQLVLQCLHPDRAPAGREDQFTKAFKIAYAAVKPRPRKRP